MNDPIQTFLEEADTHLEILEQALLELEDSPSESSLIAKAFRSMHTIKGSGGMFGFDALTEFTHVLENALDELRNGRGEATKGLITVFLDSLDHIRELLQHPKGNAELTNVSNVLLGRLTKETDPDAAARSVERPPVESQSQTKLQPGELEFLDTPQSDAAPQGAWLWRIQLKPHEESFTDGFDLQPVLKELSLLGSIRVSTRYETVAAFEDTDPERCYTMCLVELETPCSQEKIEDTFIFVQQEWSIEVKPLHQGDRGATSISTEELSGIEVDDSNRLLNESIDATSSVSEPVQSSSGGPKELLVEPEPAEAVSKTPSKPKVAEPESTVRVPVSKLDSLMDLVGELVIVQARMSETANRLHDERITEISEDLERLTTHLRDNTFDIRMLPIGTTFGRFRRLVRDLSNTLNKDIKLITEGAETELDKMVIDRLGDPLVHLIRNSIDHGIESPDNRLATGKLSQGTIHLSATHADGQVLIQIEDDGGGLDADKIKQKAIDRGLIGMGVELTDQQVYQLIFEPGFSTAKAVTDVSGRGVGMDVVKRSIEELRGTVELDSQLGKGTTISIRLPMTLAIIEGLTVAVNEERYVMPLGHVEECIELAFDETDEREKLERGRNGNHLITIRGELVPYVRLRDWFGLQGQRPSIEQIVVVRQGERRFGFCIDEVIGQQQTVIKALGRAYQNVQDSFVGATIMGDGSVAMIIDINQVISGVQRLEQVSQSGAVH